MCLSLQPQRCVMPRHAALRSAAQLHLHRRHWISTTHSSSPAPLLEDRATDLWLRTSVQLYRSPASSRSPAACPIGAGDGLHDDHASFLKLPLASHPKQAPLAIGLISTPTEATQRR